MKLTEILGKEVISDSLGHIFQMTALGQLSIFPLYLPSFLNAFQYSIHPLSTFYENQYKCNFRLNPQTCWPLLNPHSSCLLCHN